MNHDFPAAPNWTGWVSRPNTGGGWEMQNQPAWEWRDTLVPRPTYQPYEQASQQEQALRQQLDMQKMMQMFGEWKQDEEKNLLSAIHTRGKYYQRILLGELSIA